MPLAEDTGRSLDSMSCKQKNVGRNIFFNRGAACTAFNDGYLDRANEVTNEVAQEMAWLKYVFFCHTPFLFLFAFSFELYCVGPHQRPTIPFIDDYCNFFRCKVQSDQLNQPVSLSPITHTCKYENRTTNHHLEKIWSINILIRGIRYALVSCKLQVKDRFYLV